MRSVISSALLVALVATAAPPSKKRAEGISIALNKKSNFVRDGGAVNTMALQAHLAQIQSKYSNSLAAFEANTGSPHPLASDAPTRRQDNGDDNGDGNNNGGDGSDGSDQDGGDGSDQDGGDGSNPESGTNNGGSTSGTGANPLTDDQSQLWFGSISVGTPAVTYTVDFDTGSSDLFLPSSSCGSTCTGHTKYNTAKSSTAKSTGQKFTLQYGDGSSVTGTQFTDTVTIAGLTATGQILGSATTYSTGFETSQFPADGLMGLAWPQLAVLGTTKPFVNTLISQGTISKGEFGVKLAASGSELFIGGTNTDLVSGDFTTVKVTTQGYWQVSMDSANVGGSAVVSNTQAIVDTGTTLIVGPSSTVSKFYKAITGSKSADSTVGSGFFTFPCSSTPSVSITFGGTEYDISSSFNLGPATDGSSDCVGGVVSGDTGINGWILGDVFLTNVYSVYSFDDSTVSFANLA